MRLKSKIAIITGAGQGIGRETALHFAREGAQVIATDMDIEKIKDLLEIEGITRIAQMDITKKEEIEALAKTIHKIDIIFNCAGYVPTGNIFECSDAEWERTMDINVRGAFWVCKAFLPIVLNDPDPENKCSIINISSVASSLKGVENRFAYSVSKGALIALTKSIAADFISNGVRANNICPGTVETPSFFERVAASPNPDQAYKDFVSRQKMKRLGKADEIAKLAVYLASDESAYITGQEFIIDGGWSL